MFSEQQNNTWCSEENTRKKRKDAVKKKHHREKKTKAAEEFKEITNLALLKSNNLFVLKKKESFKFCFKTKWYMFYACSSIG